MVSSSTRSPFLRGAQARNTRFFLLSQRVRGAKDLLHPFALPSVPSEELQSHRRGVFGATATPRSPHPSTRDRSAEGMLAIGKN